MKKLKALLPHIVADGVSYEHSNRLVKIMETICAHNKAFADKITDNEKGRDFLAAFFQHWFDGYKKTGKWIDGLK